MDDQQTAHKQLYKHQSSDQQGSTFILQKLRMFSWLITNTVKSGLIFHEQNCFWYSTFIKCKFITMSLQHRLGLDS